MPAQEAVINAASNWLPGRKRRRCRIDQRDQDESETGRGETRRPVVYPKLEEGKHRPPVIESGLFQPGMAPENGSDVVMAEKHLAGNLRVPGFVGANQSEPISAEDRHQSIEQEKRGKNEEADGLQGVVQAREPGFQRVQAGAWPMKDLRRSHHCFFLSHRFCQAGTTTERRLNKHRLSDSASRREDSAAPDDAAPKRRPAVRVSATNSRNSAAAAIAQLRRYFRIRSVADWEWAVQGAAAGIFVTAARQTALRWWPRSPGPCCAG